MRSCPVCGTGWTAEVVVVVVVVVVVDRSVRAVYCSKRCKVAA
ncbi:hypothetical protein [Streptomyces sp. NPDC050422]